MIASGKILNEDQLFEWLVGNDIKREFAKQLIKTKPKKCTHNGTPYVYNLKGGWQAMCLNCHLEGPFGESITEAVWGFSKQIKEKPMTSEYRRGVEDATKATLEDAKGNHFLGINYFNDVVAPNIKKRLLTKKVTKWVNVFGPPRYPDHNTGQTALYYTAQHAHETGKHFEGYIGTYPIEIEVPID